MHGSVNNENYRMARLTSMKNQQTVKIGIEAQYPIGDRAENLVHYFDIMEKTVANLRDLNE